MASILFLVGQENDDAVLSPNPLMKTSGALVTSSWLVSFPLLAAAGSAASADDDDNDNDGLVLFFTRTSLLLLLVRFIGSLFRNNSKTPSAIFLSVLFFRDGFLQELARLGRIDVGSLE